MKNVSAGNNQPKDIVHSILPKRNCFVFFEVTPVSFHQVSNKTILCHYWIEFLLQVSEVFLTNKTRLSINGWFHGQSVPRPSPYLEPVPEFLPPKDLPVSESSV